jgi:hypothetical protein
MVVQLHDIGDGAGDVVRATTLVGQVDQLRDRLLWLAGGVQHVADGLRGGHGRQAVGAQQVPVAGPGVIQ